MRMDVFYWLGVLAAWCFCTTANSQEEMIFQPLAKAQAARARVAVDEPAELYELSSLVQAKVDTAESGAKIICLVESYRQIEQEMNVARVREEVRTRTVTVEVDGEQKEVEQVFTVKVPFRETAKVMSRVSAGKKPVSIEWDKAKLYRLDGTQVNLEEAKQLLSSLKPVFVIHGMRQVLPPADELIRQVVQEDTLVLVTDELQRHSAVRPPDGMLRIAQPLRR